MGNFFDTFAIFTRNEPYPIKVDDVADDSIIKTAPVDPRFPHTNQTKNCFVNFVDYHRCDRLLGPSDECKQFLKAYTTFCPMAWIEKWEEQIEGGYFPVKLPPKREEKEDPLE